MDERIAKLLTLAISAPSGDNCQPWRFTVTDRQIRVFNVPQRDTSLYNFRQLASMVAHGALLENLLIAAPSLGFVPRIGYFPDPGDPDLVATVDLEEGPRFEDPLLPWLLKRCTNRKKYARTPLTAEQKNLLQRATNEIAEVTLGLESDPEKVRDLAAVLANNDRLVFENPHLHRFLFDHIRWSEEEARARCDGMDLQTLELGLADALAFRFLKHWPLVETLNRIGLSKMVALNGKKLVASAAGIAVLAAPDASAGAFVQAGRAMERFWLEATRLGLSVQPVAGLALLIQRLRSAETQGLTEPQAQVVSRVSQSLDQAFGLEGRHIAILLRVGSSAPPQARALRPPVAVFIRD